MGVPLPEAGDLIEFQHKVPTAELEHAAAVAKVMKVARHELPMLSAEAAVVELEHAATMAEVTEVSLLEVPMLSEAAVVEL
jgi:hypothetical protein